LSRLTTISDGTRCLTFEHPLTSDYLSRIATAFLSRSRSDMSLHVKAVFQATSLRSYRIDMSGPAVVITFSRLPEPETLDYRGRPARIVEHQTHLKLTVTEQSKL